MKGTESHSRMDLRPDLRVVLEVLGHRCCPEGNCFSRRGRLAAGRLKELHEVARGIHDEDL
jgi:hypothetical protein